MDWANDELGRLVHAADRHLFAYGFTCPTCAERVRLRAGLERRPHFAHYSHSPKPDCENYHPSGYQVATAFRSGREQSRRSSIERISLHGGIFLDREERGRFSLYLKLPRLKPDLEANGELRVQSGVGVRVFSALKLREPQFVRVSPQVPLVEVSGFDDMEEAVAAVEQDISLFQPSGNVFHASGESGRLLGPGEPLEWGEVYRILSQQSLAAPPFGLGCELVARGGGWFLYEIKIPAVPEDREGPIGDTLSRYLDRAIRRPRARIYIVDPIPHHTAPDGTYIYPLPPARLLLRRTARLEIEVQGSAWTGNSNIRDAGKEWVEICALGSGEAAISHSGEVQINVRVEDCDLFAPQGIQLSVGENISELFAEGVNVAVADNLESVTIQCPTNRIADFIRVEGSKWERRGSQYALRSGVTRPSVDAGNFGVLRWLEGEASFEAPTPASTAGRLAKRMWIEGVVARAAGTEALEQVRRLWVHRDVRRLQAFAGSNAWLKPYIHAALN